MQNFVAIGSWVSAPQIRDFAVPFDVTSMFVVFGYSVRLQPTPLNGGAVGSLVIILLQIFS